MAVETRTAAVGGVEAYWRQAGSGPPVVLLHGLGASSYSWRGVLPALAERFTVYVPDLPGFGRSGAPGDFDYCFNGLSRWVVAFLDHLGLESAALAGNSMGGVVSLMTAMDFPARVSRLALLGTPTYIGDRPKLLWPLRWPVVGRLYESLLGPGLVRIVARSAYKDPAILTEEVVQEYALSLRRPEGRRAAAEILRNAIPKDAAQFLARYKDIQHSVLVICGDSDNVVGIASARRFCGEAPKARLMALDACGHAAQEEKPDAVAAALMEFFA